MSNEFDNQITESVFNDKIFNFYQKKKILHYFFYSNNCFMPNFVPDESLI